MGGPWGAVLWVGWQHSFLHLRGVRLEEAGSCFALFVWAFTGWFLLSSVSSYTGPERREKAWKLTVALDFSFSGRSRQLPTDIALNFAESHSKMPASALHITVP